MSGQTLFGASLSSHVAQVSPLIRFPRDMMLPSTADKLPLRAAGLLGGSPGSWKNTIVVRGRGNVFVPREPSLNQTCLAAPMDSKNKYRNIYYPSCSTGSGRADLFGSSFINRVKYSILLENIVLIIKKLEIIKILIFIRRIKGER